jgi:hypothetical protein
MAAELRTLSEEGKETNQSILDHTPHPDVISAGAYQAFKTPEYRTSIYISLLDLSENIEPLVVSK